MSNPRPSVTLFYPLSRGEIKEKLRQFALDNNLSKDALEEVQEYVIEQFDDLNSFIDYGNVFVVNEEEMLEDEEGRLSLGSSWEDVFEEIEGMVGEDHAQEIFDLFFYE